MEEHEDKLKEEAKANQGARTDLNGSLGKSIKVDNCLAEISKTSRQTVQRVRFIRNSKNKQMISEVSSGKISIGRAFCMLKSGSSDSCVYFIKSENNKIKIGTTYYIERRLSNLQSVSPCDLELIGVIGNQSEDLERKLHRKFKFCHSHGEWFDAHEDLLKYIEDNSIRRNITNKTEQDIKREYDKTKQKMV